MLTISPDNAKAQPTAKTKDRARVWLWWFLAVVAASQLYFVRELLAAFALFALAFVALAIVAASLYAVVKAWALAVNRLAALRLPVLNMARAASVATVATVAHEERKAA